MTARGAALALLLCGAARAGSPAPAAAPVVPAPVKRELPGAPVELKTIDGWTLKGVYRAPTTDELVLVLLHGRGQTKEFWRRLARRLAAEGMGYIAVDLRGHGASATGPDGQPAPWRKFKTGKAESDWENIRFDVQAAVAYLKAQAIPEEHIPLLGTDVGGSIALKYASVNPKAPMLVWLSPGMSYADVPTVNAMRAYKNRPILMVYSELDKRSSRETPILYQFAIRSAGDRNATVLAVKDRHGHKLVSGGPVIGQVVAWLRDPVKPEAPVVESTDTATSPADDEEGAEEEDAEEAQ